MKPLLHEAARKGILVCDGAMGTQLMLAGLSQGACGEAWNVEQPDRVLSIQKRYAEAGADCIITNTFGANRVGLSRHGRERDLVEINRAGARIAREALGAKPGYVLGDIGPLGVFIEPYGEMPVEDARAALEEQAAALVGAGVDAIIVETQTCIEELELGIEAARKAGARCIIASLAYDRSADGQSYRTMMGVSPEQAAKFVGTRNADIVALNCGRGMDMLGAAQVARIYRENCALPIMVQPNAGQPVLHGDKLVYRQTPSEMAEAVPVAIAAGAAIIGSCCGSTPEHTAAIRAAVGRR